MADHQEPMTLASQREEARSLYGSDADGYAAGRPDYPAEVYETLTDRCGLGPGARVLEIGPGTGLVTRHLLDAGARVAAVEPDPAMAAYLTAHFGARAEVIVGTFEHAELDHDAFDLAVAACSFHWVDHAVGIPKLGRVVRPGGWIALWWTIFDDPEQENPFRALLEARVGEEDPGGQRHTRWHLDTAARRDDLHRLGGFTDVTAELLHWAADMDAARLRALYGSLIKIRRRPAQEQQRVLAAVEAAAASFPGGTVRHPFMTIVYTARASASENGYM
jgi:SAM-dependent methyltransferase